MHLYWRVQQDLKCLGETLVFHDPSFIRSFRAWMEKNACGLAMAEDYNGQDMLKTGTNSAFGSSVAP